MIAVLCNEAELDNGTEIRGSSTEGALLRAALGAGIDYRKERIRYPLLRVRPRGDGDNWMATLHEDGPARRLVAVKGAPEEVVRLADRWLDGAIERPLTDERRGAILRANAGMAARGLRVLALAFREENAGSEPTYGELYASGWSASPIPFARACAKPSRRAPAPGSAPSSSPATRRRRRPRCRASWTCSEGAPRVLEAGQLVGMNNAELRRHARDVDVFARRALGFLLSTNLSEILVTLGALCVGVARPLSAIQFLWINLLSDVAPALALAVEPAADPHAMSRPPDDPAQPLLSRPMLGKIGADAAVLAAATLGIHGLALARYGAGPRATTLAFSTLTSAQLLHALVYRSRGAASSTGAPSPLLGGVVAGSLAFQASTLLVPPLRRLLGLTVPSAGDWALIAAGAAAPCSSMRSGGYSGRPPRHRPEGPVP